MTTENVQEALLEEIRKLNGAMSDSVKANERHTLEQELFECEKHLAAGEASLAKTRERVAALRQSLGQTTKETKLSDGQVYAIARICHETNRAYCLSLGDKSQAAWDEAPEWQRTSCINGVRHHLEHPDTTPEGSHEVWLAEKREAGWKYGPVKDAEKKEHPCCLPYSELSESDKAKDYIFRAIVRELGAMLGQTSSP